MGVDLKMVRILNPLMLDACILSMNHDKLRKFIDGRYSKKNAPKAWTTSGARGSLCVYLTCALVLDAYLPPEK